MHWFFVASVFVPNEMPACNVTKTELVTKDPYLVPLHLTTAAGSDRLVETSVPVILPHELFAALFEQGPERWATSMGNQQEMLQYWRHVLTHSEWAKDHPVIQGTPSPESVLVPLTLYGDCARVTREDSMLCLTWGSALAFRTSALDSRHLIASIPTTYVGDTSITQLSQVTAWSFATMMDGRWPTTNHKGQPWPKGSKRDFLAGSPLSGPFKALLAECRGDWEWYGKFFHAPTASCNLPCWLCFASKGAGPLAWADVTPTALWQHSRRPPSFLRDLPNANPIAKLPGFQASQLRIDVMHTVCLGLCLWSNAGALICLCRRGHFGIGNFSVQLTVAFRRFQLWLHRLGLNSSQRPFNPRRVLGQHGALDYAEMASKAWNSRLITNWLDEELRHLPGEDGDGEARLTVALISLLNRSFHLSESWGRFLTEAQAESYAQTVERCVRIYRELARHCMTHPQMVYPLRPKVHLFLEAARAVREDRLNPRFSHTFSDEGYLKVLLRCARASPRAALSAAVVRRWLLRVTLRWHGRVRTQTSVRTQPRTRRPFRVLVRP